MINSRAFAYGLIAKYYLLQWPVAKTFLLISSAFFNISNSL